MNVLNISPDKSVAHTTLRDDFRRYVESKGFIFSDFGIEWRANNDALRVLGSMSDNTALYLRGSPDAWIAHPGRRLAVQVEFKSRDLNQAAENMALEAQPLASAIQRSRPPLSVRVLYVYRDPVLNLDAGFWCHEPPIITRLYLSDKDAGIHNFVRSHFGGAEVMNGNDVRGSGDSFALVLKRHWTRLDHWKDLVNDLL